METVSSSGGGFLSAPLGGQLLKRYPRHFHMDVDAVHHGAGDAFLIARDHTVGTGAGVGGVAEIAARTGVLGGDEHEAGREGDRAGGA